VSLDHSDDNDLLTALRHPLRRRILRRMDKDEAQGEEPDNSES